eukprot:jgi/Astpho2/6453/fgenesh1_pg.00095_%23_4_t
MSGSELLPAQRQTGSIQLTPTAIFQCLRAMLKFGAIRALHPAHIHLTLRWNTVHISPQQPVILAITCLCWAEAPTGTLLTAEIQQPLHLPKLIHAPGRHFKQPQAMLLGSLQWCPLP